MPSFPQTVVLTQPEYDNLTPEHRHLFTWTKTKEGLPRLHYVQYHGQGPPDHIQTQPCDVYLDLSQKCVYYRGINEWHTWHGNLTTKEMHVHLHQIFPERLLFKGLEKQLQVTTSAPPESMAWNFLWMKNTSYASNHAPKQTVSVQTLFDRYPEYTRHDRPIPVPRTRNSKRSTSDDDRGSETPHPEASTSVHLGQRKRKAEKSAAEDLDASIPEAATSARPVKRKRKTPHNQRDVSTPNPPETLQSTLPSMSTSTPTSQYRTYSSSLAESIDPLLCLPPEPMQAVQYLQRTLSHPIETPHELAAHLLQFVTQDKSERERLFEKETADRRLQIDEEISDKRRILEELVKEEEQVKIRLARQHFLLDNPLEVLPFQPLPPFEHLDGIADIPDVDMTSAHEDLSLAINLHDASIHSHEPSPSKPLQSQDDEPAVSSLLHDPLSDLTELSDDQPSPKVGEVGRKKIKAVIIDDSDNNSPSTLTPDTRPQKPYHNISPGAILISSKSQFPPNSETVTFSTGLEAYLPFESLVSTLIYIHTLTF